MGYTAQPGSEYNVIGSLNDYFRQQVTAHGVPDWLISATGSAAAVNFDFPQEPLTLPSWSVTHLGSQPVEIAEGRNLDPGFRGVQRVGLAEINCWLSWKAASSNPWGELRQMRDMAARVFATGAAVPILDLYGSTGTPAPTANGTTVRVDPAQEVAVTPDLNPDVLRIRLLAQYRWLERVSTAG